MDCRIVAVVDSDPQGGNAVCTLLGKTNYRVLAFQSLKELESYLDECTPGVLILDLDNLATSNGIFRTLKARNRDMHIIGLSSRSHHPELREALSTDITATVRKPLDETELLYWIRSLLEC